MDESVQDRTAAEAGSTCTRRIEVRLALPTPQVRYVQGKPVRDPAPGPERIIAAIRPTLERLNLAHHGAQTELRITASPAPGIRVDGNFGEKAGSVQARVQGWLDGAFEELSELLEE